MPTIEVITGPMFSGKTDKLIRLMEHVEIARVPFVLVKPKKDTRCVKRIASRRGKWYEAFMVDTPKEIVPLAKEALVVGIDEAHFFDLELVRVVNELSLAMKKRVIVAGLDLDFLGMPFETMASLLALATHVDKRYAICSRCGDPAYRSQRLVENSDRELVGDGEYEARCLACFAPPC